MCFECGMTGKRCEGCHYLCLLDVPDYSDYTIEISFCCEDGVKVNLFLRGYMNVSCLCGDVG